MTHKNLKLLNPSQREAVTYKDAPLLIVAGAGSGKTRVLTHRIAYLVESGVNPYNILALTFTNKAAGEMRSRVVSLVPGVSYTSFWLGTFHGICLRILKAESKLLGSFKNFIIYDGTDQIALIKECVKNLNLDEKKYKAGIVCEKISRAKDDCIGPKEYLGMADNFYQQLVAKIYKKYQERLREIGALDFGDLITYTISLFKKHPATLEKYRNKFQHVLIDEYQDTNHAQYIFLKLLTAGKKNITVVGDPDQSIFGWRGANISNIMNFEKDFPNVKTIKLEENYRSTQAILSSANNIIKNNRERKEKALWTKNTQGDMPMYCNNEDDIEEAELVAGQIEEFLSQGGTYKDIAVFYRIHSLSRVIEDALRRISIPYVIVGGVRFYDRKEVKDILAYLRVISNPNDVISLKRIINLPARGIGDVSLKKIENYLDSRDISLFDTLSELNNIDISIKTKEKISAFVGFIRKHQCFEGSLAGMLKKLIEDLDYFNYLKRQDLPGTEERIENIKELISAIAEYEENSESPSLVEFLEQVALTSDIDNWDNKSNAVTLMTLHSAKGLEFPACFIIGMEEDILPHKKLSTGESNIEEERRLCYVGMTRAQERLYCSSAKRRRIYGRWQDMETSRFIEEMGVELLAHQ